MCVRLLLAIWVVNFLMLGSWQVTRGNWGWAISDAVLAAVYLLMLTLLSERVKGLISARSK